MRAGCTGQKQRNRRRNRETHRFQEYGREKDRISVTCQFREYEVHRSPDRAGASLRKPAPNPLDKSSRREIAGAHGKGCRVLDDVRRSEDYFFLVPLVNHSAQRCGGNAKSVISATINKSTTMRKKRATRCPLL